MIPSNQEFEKDIGRAAQYIRSIIKKEPEVAVILGSGLSGFADTAFTSTRGEISYAQIPGLPDTTVVGHRGTLYYGDIGGKFSVCFAGRFHSYEGHPPPILTLIPRLAAALGCEIYIMTNAAGGTLRGMKTGCLMSIESHGATTRFTGVYGCEGVGCKPAFEFSSVEEFIEKVSHCDYPQQIDSRDVYSKELRRIAAKIAEDPEFVGSTEFELNGERRRVALHNGTYVFNSGPAFESHSETRYCLENAPGVVGMSSVPEALMARALGMHVFGMSLVTNLASGLSDEIIAHEDVTRVANSVGKAVQELVSRLIQETDLQRIEKLAKIGQLNTDSPLTPVNEPYASADEVDALCKRLEGTNHVILHTSNISCPHALKIIGKTAFIGIPRETGLSATSQILLACQKLGICSVNLVDCSLPSGSLIHCGSVVNMTGWQYFPYNTTRKAPEEAGNRLLLVDGWENPNTNIYLTSLAKRENIEYLSNCSSAVPVVLADILGINLHVVSPDKCMEECLLPIVPGCSLSSFSPKFNVFECNEVKFEEAEAVFSKLPAFEKAIVLDFLASGHAESVKKVVTALNATRIEEVTEFEAYVVEKTVILVIPPLYANNTFKEVAIVGRVLSFNKSASITVLCNGSDDFFEVTDICNQAAINPLRGHNDERFGPRFNDLSNIVSGRTFKNIKGKVAVLTLAPLLRCREASSSIGSLVAEGGLQIMVVLSHQGGGKRWAVCGPVESLLNVM